MKPFYLVLLLVVFAVIIALVRKYLITKTDNFLVEVIVSGITILILVMVFRFFWRR